MAAKTQSEKNTQPDKAPAAEPALQRTVHIRVKTRYTGAKHTQCGVIFDGSWKPLTLDRLGSAYKLITTDPRLVFEAYEPPTAAQAKVPAKAETKAD